MFIEDNTIESSTQGKSIAPNNKQVDKFSFSHVLTDFQNKVLPKENTPRITASLSLGIFSASEVIGQFTKM